MNCHGEARHRVFNPLNTDVYSYSSSHKCRSKTLSVHYNIGGKGTTSALGLMACSAVAIVEPSFSASNILRQQSQLHLQNLGLISPLLLTSSCIHRQTTKTTPKTSKHTNEAIGRLALDGGIDFIYSLYRNQYGSWVR